MIKLTLRAKDFKVERGKTADVISSLLVIFAILGTVAKEYGICSI